MSSRTLEQCVVEHCAPTLAGLKCGSLFRFYFEDEQDAVSNLKEVNEKLNVKDLYLEALTWSGNSVLVYSYRKKKLKAILARPDVTKVLRRNGYREKGVKSNISHLKERMLDPETACFPHEIGIFLGYSIDDVIKFIEHKGCNSMYCGIWKVYCDVEEKRKIFDCYDKCKVVYDKVFKNGKNIVQMTVCG